MRNRSLLAIATLVPALALVSNPACRAAAGRDPSGLVLTFDSPPTASNPGLPDARVARLVALCVPSGTAPSVLTPPGPFRATFEGDLNQRLRSYVNFLAHGRGKLTLNINGAQVLSVAGEDFSATLSPQVRLNKGKNQLVAVYESPESGDASLRLFWSSRTWQPEPVPPMVFTHAEPAGGVAESIRMRQGRFLLAEFRCTKCHAAPELANAKNAMPELAMDAPSLADAGARFNRDWLAAWISNPKALRPDAHMPRLFAADADPRPGHIAAFLTSLGKPFAAAPQADANRGGRIFANLDCIACHTTAPSTETHGRVPLSSIAAKYTPAALRQYLLNPQLHYGWNPMPNFHLSQEEAEDLSAFLLSEGTGKLRESRGDPAKGKQLIASAKCLNCHRLGDQNTTASAPPLSALSSGRANRGCLASDPDARGIAPDFALSTEQRTALLSFLGTDRGSLARDCAPEFADRQFTAMRCIACHARDGNESLLVQDFDAEAQALHQAYPNAQPAAEGLWAADQRPPMLTYAGEKLRPEWTAQFIAGRLPYKPRYYLRARMPSFSARADLLAEGLAEEHGCGPALPPVPKPDPNLSEIGRKLCGKQPNQGFSCVQCHAVADAPPFAAFEAPSVNFRYAAERLRDDYYLRWMHDPLRIDPTTKMPRFDDAQGKTSLPTLDGDSHRQFEAIWQYLLEGASIKPPPQ